MLIDYWNFVIKFSGFKMVSYGKSFVINGNGSFRLIADLSLPQSRAHVGDNKTLKYGIV